MSGFRHNPYSPAFADLAQQAIGVGGDLIQGVTGVTLTPSYHVMIRLETTLGPVASMMFPVLPQSMDKVRAWYNSVTATLGGGYILRHDIYPPFPITIEGNFGMRPRIAIGTIEGAALRRHGLLPLEALFTGYAACRTLEAICDLSVDREFDGSELWLYVWPIAALARVAVRSLRIGMRHSEPQLSTYQLTVEAIEHDANVKSPYFLDRGAMGAVLGAAASQGISTMVGALGRSSDLLGEVEVGD